MTKAIFCIFLKNKKTQAETQYLKQTLVKNGKNSKFEVGKGWGRFLIQRKKDSEVDEYAHAYKGFDK